MGNEEKHVGVEQTRANDGEKIGTSNGHLLMTSIMEILKTIKRTEKNAFFRCFMR